MDTAAADVASTLPNYSINYTKYYAYNDTACYYFDKLSEEKKIVDDKNEFIDYISKSTTKIKADTKKYLKLNNTEEFSFIDCEKSNYSLSSLLKFHFKKINIIWNPKIEFCNFYSEHYFVAKPSQFDACSSEQMTIYIITSKRQDDKKLNGILAKFYYYGLLNSINKTLWHLISNRVVFLPLQDNLFDSRNFISYNCVESIDTIIYELNKIHRCITNCRNSSGKRIYPNMKNTFDFPFHSHKKQLANRIDEITQYYYCSPRERDHYISTFPGQKYTTRSFGFKKKSNKTVLIDEILANRKVKQKKGTALVDRLSYKSDDLSVLKDKLKYLNKYKYHCFIDFEVINNIISCESQVPNLKFINSIFNIGLSIINTETQETVFHSFYLNDYTDVKLETKMVNRVFELIDELGTERCAIFHWSHAEISFLNDFNRRVGGDDAGIGSQGYNFIDLYKLYIDNSIIVKGMKSFKLKELYKNLFYDETKINVNDIYSTIKLEFYEPLKVTTHELDNLNNFKSSISDGLETIGYMLMNNNQEFSRYLPIIYYNILDCYYLQNLLKVLYLLD